MVNKLIDMSNIKNIEKFLKDALMRVKAADCEFDAAMLDSLSDEEYDYPEFENRLMEIELSLSDYYPETAYFGYLMSMIAKIKEVYGIDEENIDELFLNPDNETSLEFPAEELTDEDRDFEENEDDCLDYIFES